jgi:hypothetical protein
MTQACWDVDPFHVSSDDDERPSDDIWDGEKTFWQNLNLDELD